MFNTSMAGYEEILSDRSYTDQAVVMTYPLIGNYGVNAADAESESPTVGGLIVGEYNPLPSNFRSEGNLSDWLCRYGIPGIEGLDTRMLARSIREHGSRRGILTDRNTTIEEGLRKIAETPVPHDAVRRVSTKRFFAVHAKVPRYRVAAIDCGMKSNIVRSLNRLGCDVTVFPYDTTAEEILRFHPDGLFLSNGPGDPEDVKPVIALVAALKGKMPIFGICLGHQMIALAYGASTYKLKFGHRGGNHPVKNQKTNPFKHVSGGDPPESVGRNGGRNGMLCGPCVLGAVSPGKRTRSGGQRVSFQSVCGRDERFWRNGKCLRETI